jgi:ABC-2 type transport system permease protein
MNRTLIGFLKKEFLQILRDPRMRFIVFGVPVIQLTVFGTALSTEVRNIRLLAVYQPGDTLADELFRRALASGWFVAAHSGRDPADAIQAGEADAAFVAPAGGLTRGAARGAAPLQVLIDASNVVRARAAEGYLQAALAEVLKDEAAHNGLPTGPTGVALDVRILYNPSLESSQFLVPGVMGMLVCVVTIILTSMALTRERELGTFETLIAAPVQRWEIIAGKTIPYFILGIVVVALALGVAMAVFGVPLRGPLWALVLASLMFLAATVSVGMLISTYCKNQQQATLAGLLVLFPAIMLSGVMFPVDTMPLWLRVFTYVNPITYYVGLMRNILLKGGETVYVLRQAGILGGLAAVLLFFSYRRFHGTLD